jgi:hypothetical protein
MANKRISQLTSLTATEVQPVDAFVIVDISTLETKKITAAELSAYMSLSGSVYAVHAINSDTASYIVGSNVFGPVSVATTATTATTATSATSATTATSASHALRADTSSFTTVQDQAKSASFLIYSSGNGTASFAIKSSTAISVNTASFLLYTGANTGTASYALFTKSASWASVVKNAETASHFQNLLGTVDSASYAGYASNAGTAQTAAAAAFLQYSSTNGTASYAMAAQTTPEVMASFGVTKAQLQRNSMSILQNVSVLPLDSAAKQTMITAHGTVRIPYTASTPTDGEATLYIRDRTTGDITQLESTPLSVIMSPSVDEWGTFTTGSVRMPFSLVGQANMLGHYYVYVSASTNISIDSARTTSFVIDSKSDRVSAYPTESMQFITVPDSTATWYNIAGGGPYISNASDVGTASAIIGKVDVSNQPITDVRYIWALPNLTEFKSSDISFLTSRSALPNTCSILSCSDSGLSNTVGNLPRLPLSLSYFDISANAYVTFPFTTLPVSLSYFDCSNNSLTSLPALPPSLSYFDCSDNELISVPLMPSGTLRFFCDNNQITSLASLPNTILTMSCGNNPITSIDYLPSQSLYINFRNTDIAGLPYMPLSVSFLDASVNTLFTSSALGNICSQLVANNQKTGSLDISSNGIPNVGTLTDIATLQSRNWSVSYDT